MRTDSVSTQPSVPCVPIFFLYTYWGPSGLVKLLSCCNLQMASLTHEGGRWGSPHSRKVYPSTRKNLQTGNRNGGSGRQGYLALSLRRIAILRRFLVAQSTWGWQCHGACVHLGLWLSATSFCDDIWSQESICLCTWGFCLLGQLFCCSWGAMCLLDISIPVHLCAFPSLSPAFFFLYGLKFTDLCGLWLVWMSKIVGAFKDWKCTAR